MDTHRIGKPVNWPWSGVWPWVIGIVLVVVIAVPMVTSRVGRCVDFADSTGQPSYCVTGPALGVEATWAVGILATLLVVFLAYGLVRATRATRARSHRQDVDA
ncbi:hypothetical protein [Arthrobacter sp. B6]|uniref:hypothetical protein n=1 Tax=Arthrobacter sp. B6 TaxID=1570137 RepID=UPI0008314506|nr:hypothetical protein [Arthrobacter sp. B6]